MTTYQRQNSLKLKIGSHCVPTKQIWVFYHSELSNAEIFISPSGRLFTTANKINHLLVCGGRGGKGEGWVTDRNAVSFLGAFSFLAPI
jgi:hypothetical protein